MMALSVQGVRVSYGRTEILGGIDLAVERGEVVALLGPSGSGKTTLLFAVAGFVPVSSGTIAVGDRDVAGPDLHEPPEQRAVAFVFQSYALWPHLTALDTVVFPLRAAGGDLAEARGEARRLLAAVGMGGLEDRRPAELSGGQQQRVGLARALARKASLYLFDEPTAHLDAATRNAVQAEVAARRADTGAAALYATHDADEALAVADRVALIRDGKLVQMGTPAEAYERPVDRWAAELTGPVSVIEIEVRSGIAVVGTEASTLAEPYPADGHYSVAVRPDWANLGGPLGAVVVDSWFRGPHTDIRLDTPGGTVVVRAPGRIVTAAGERVGWTLRRVWPVAG
jgi:ABC-type Fe3+/spermidine/putrescine transport system ATPase subunit